MLSLYRQLQDWAVANRDFLANFAPHDGEQNYLRVVTRVYVTGELDISMSDASSAAAGADAGVPKPLDLLTARPPAEGDVFAVALRKPETWVAAKSIAPDVVNVRLLAKLLAGEVTIVRFPLVFART